MAARLRDRNQLSTPHACLRGIAGRKHIREATAYHRSGTAAVLALHGKQASTGRCHHSNGVRPRLGEGATPSAPDIAEPPLCPGRGRRGRRCAAPPGLPDVGAQPGTEAQRPLQQHTAMSGHPESERSVRWTGFYSSEACHLTNVKPGDTALQVGATCSCRSG